VFEAKDVLARVEKMGDLFAPVQTLKQTLPQLAGLGGEPEKEPKKQEKEKKEKEETAGVAVESGKRPVPKKQAKLKTAAKSPAKNRRKI
jgi:hypothetical protein